MLTVVTPLGRTTSQLRDGGTELSRADVLVPKGRRGDPNRLARYLTRPVIIWMKTRQTISSGLVDERARGLIIFRASELANAH